MAAIYEEELLEPELTPEYATKARKIINAQGQADR